MGRVTIRFSEQEYKDLAAEAGLHGLGTATYIRARLQVAQDRDRLAAAMENEQAAREEAARAMAREADLWEKLFAALGFVRAVSWEQAKASNLPVTEIHRKAAETAARLMAGELTRSEE
jgi:hypothetical protein